MDLNDIHPDIRLFIGNCSSTNFKFHKIGTVTAFSFKIPKITLLFRSLFKEEYFILYDNKRYSDLEFLRMLKLKIYW